MKAILNTITGEKKGYIDLPVQFEEEIRPDLIKRAVLAQQSTRIQPRGTDPDAGHKYSSKLSRRRRDYKTAYGHGISRVPRKIMSHRGTRFNWQAATAPNTVGGRQAHPPQVEKKWLKKINIKERRKAIRSALAASVNKELVLQRGHIVQEYPLVIETEFETFKKTREVSGLLHKLGLKDEMIRSTKKTQNTGKAKRRGRKYKKRKGPLIVVSGNCNLMKSATNIPGIEVIEVKNLNAEVLAPGCHVGRLTLYTKKAIEMFKEQHLFIDNKPIKIIVKTRKKDESNN